MKISLFSFKVTLCWFFERKGQSIYTVPNMIWKNTSSTDTRAAYFNQSSVFIFTSFLFTLTCCAFIAKKCCHHLDISNILTKLCFLLERE